MTASRTIMQVSAEREPLAKVGGLGEATAGLSNALTSLGWDIHTVIPDYGHISLDDESFEWLPVPHWAGRVWARRGHMTGGAPVTLIGNDALRRPHPYVDPATGEAWADNDARFMAFSAGAAALADLDRPGILHAHDWHAAASLCLVNTAIPTVLSIHNLAHQGVADQAWIPRIGPAAAPMRIPGACDPLVGGIRRADAVVTVSPTYRDEIRTSRGEGIAELLAAKGALFGILNGIDGQVWNPATDLRITHAYGPGNVSGKLLCNQHLRRRLGCTGRRGPIVVVMSRMAHQKGIDLAIAASTALAESDFVLVFHGEGQRDVLGLTHHAAQSDGAHVKVIEGYDETIAHRLIAGADILLMPSRFEPCGLTQLQAMTYGTIPIVTDVGGLHDTVVDADRYPDYGTGFVADRADVASIQDAIRRALAAFGEPARWDRVTDRAMASDWTWTEPARRYGELYASLFAPGKSDELAMRVPPSLSSAAGRHGARPFHSDQQLTSSQPSPVLHHQRSKFVGQITSAALDLHRGRAGGQ